MRAEDRVLIKNLAQTAEIVNTINGGMSQANLVLEKGASEWTAVVRVPGVNPERMRVELRNGQLFLFHLMADENAADVELPFLLVAIPLDKRIDFDAIVAEYEDRELFITMPLDEEASGYEREVDIFKR